MYGAIIGDLAGSIYEFGQIKSVSPVTINNVIEPESFISDDSILTIAIADAILNKKDYANSLREWARKYIDYHPDFEPYFQSSFSPGFTKWVLDGGQGTSKGNGAMMRVSPVGYLFDTEEDVIKHAKLATIPSHNNEDSIVAATLVSLIIFHARNGMKKEDIIKKLNIDIKTPKIEKFNYSCEETVDVCLYSLFTSNSFEEAIRKSISFGGDTDTNACIVGSMAEAMYGIPENLKEKMIPHLPLDFLSVLADYENHLQSKTGTEPSEK